MTLVARRLLHGAGMLLAVSFLAFALAQMAPGDYYSALRNDPHVSKETIAALRTQSGLDRPFAVRYVAWLAGLLHGDFGYSLAYRAPVAELLKDRLAATLLLTGTATALAWLVAVPLGIWSAVRRGGWGDACVTAATSLLLAVPDVVLALALLFVAVETGWLPVGGMVSRDHSAMGVAARWSDIIRHMAIPAAVLVAGLAPVLIRHARAAMVDVLDAPFALSARAQGIPQRRLLFHHLLPVALNPLISLAGFSLGTLLSASLLIEVVSGWPGLGPLFLEAVMSRDLAVVLAVVMLSGLFLLIGNLAADLLLYRMDPRIRTVDG